MVNEKETPLAANRSEPDELLIPALASETDETA